MRRFRLPVPVLVLFLASMAGGNPPLWWSEAHYSSPELTEPDIPPVLNTNPANHRGPANIGQAKHMARSALAALRSVHPAAATAIEADLVGPGKPIPHWNPPANQADRDANHAPLLIGQLKAIAHPFYTHLHAAAPDWLAQQRTANGTESGGIFPWTEGSSDDNNRAMANLGQLKSVFSLDFAHDTDGDTLPDLAEHAFGTDPNNQDSDGDGVPDSEEVGDGNDPNPTDSDGDSLDDGSDADPTEALVDWERTPESKYLLIDIDAPAGQVAIDLNDHGEVLFDEGIFADGQWTSLLPEDPFIGAFTREPGDQGDYEYESQFEFWKAFNDSRQMIAQSLCRVGFTPDPGSGLGGGDHFLYSLLSRPQSENQQYDTEMLSLLPVPLRNITTTFNPLGVAREGKVVGFASYFEDTDSSPEYTILEERSRLVVFPPDNGDPQIIVPPDDFVLWTNGYPDTKVSASGWITSQGRKTIQENSEAEPEIIHRVHLWNPQLTQVPLPDGTMESFQFRLNLAELPNGRMGLVGVSGENADGLVVMENTANEMVDCQSLSELGMQYFAGDGTAITRPKDVQRNGITVSEYHLWRNGELIPLGDLCERYRELIDEGWNLHPVKANNGGMYLVVAEGPQGQVEIKLLVPIELVPDWNRDGRITDEDSGKATDESPFVFWINDDDDDNEEPHFGDVPGQGVDNADAVVNGERDLVDFFPIQLRIDKLLKVFPPESHSYKISHPAGALRFIEMPNVTPDSLRATGAGSYLANEIMAAEALSRPLKDTGEGGSELSAEYLNAVANGTGVLLFESMTPSNQSFELVVFRKSDNSELARTPSEAWMNLVPVEGMYWRVNIRAAVEPGFTLPAIEIAQNERFRESRKDRWFVFCHGYNVNEEAARGWNAEIFKRLHQMGSDSKFLGVSWEGNQGQVMTSLDFEKGKTPDYWQNVRNAFISSAALSTLVNGLDDGETVIAGHSLGNMLVSSAICDHDLRSKHYFMINAAVAREAYSATHVPTDRNSVRNERWKDYATRLWPTDYWNLGFATADGRRKLKWQSRFSDLVTKTTPHNYYSSGEEVLKSGDGTTPGLLTDIIFKRGEGAWIKQEMGKGEATKVFATGGTNGNWVKSGGWGFNWQDPPATDEDAVLQTKPFFQPFRSFDGQSIHGANGSALAAIYSNRAYLLGHDVPALSNPAGSNIVSFGGDVEQKNTNMDAALRSGNWGDWKHCDLKEQKMDLVWKLFSDMVSKGDLNERLTPPPIN